MHDLVERQIQQVVTALFHHDLGGVGHDLLHCIQIQPVARDLRRFFVLGNHLIEALGITHRLLHHALPVALSLLLQTRCHTFGLRQHVVGVGLAFVFLPLAILSGFDGVFKGCLHFFRRLCVLHVDFLHVDAGLVTIQNDLHQLVHFILHIGTALLHHVIHGAFADDFANGRFGRLQYSIVGRAVFHQVIARAFHHPLHGELYIDDVFVVGQHQRFFQHFALDVVTVTHFHAAHL